MSNVTLDRVPNIWMQFSSVVIYTDFLRTILPTVSLNRKLLYVVTWLINRDRDSYRGINLSRSLQLVTRNSRPVGEVILMTLMKLVQHSFVARDMLFRCNFSGLSVALRKLERIRYWIVSRGSVLPGTPRKCSVDVVHLQTVTM